MSSGLIARAGAVQRRHKERASAIGAVVFNRVAASRTADLTPMVDDDPAVMPASGSDLSSSADWTATWPAMPCYTRCSSTVPPPTLIRENLRVTAHAVR